MDVSGTLEHTRPLRLGAEMCGRLTPGTVSRYTNAGASVLN